MSTINATRPVDQGPGPSGQAQSTDPIDPYMALIQGDPIYQQTLASNAASLAQAGAQLGNSVANLVVQLGYVPDMNTIGKTLGLSPAMVSWLKSNVDWSAVGHLAAESNKSHTSILSQLADQHGANVGSIKDSLAARGLYRSGGLGSDLGREAQRFTGSNYRALHEAANSIGGLYNSYLGVKSGLDQANLQALTDAYQREQQLYPDGVPSAAAPTGPVVPGNPSSDPAAWQYPPRTRTGPFVAV